jgi:hypothetical protein
MTAVIKRLLLRLGPGRGCKILKIGLKSVRHDGSDECSLRQQTAWCRVSDSNGRPTAYKAVALPAELTRPGPPMLQGTPKVQPSLRAISGVSAGGDQ